jgi:hypothetical protein
MTAALASLIGEQLAGNVVTPRRVESDTGPLDGMPAYSLGTDVLHYQTWDPIHGCVGRETADPDELRYWIVDDIASGLAWRWAQTAPSYAAMSEQRALRTRWMSFWRILMHALRPDWGRRTRETIRVLAQSNPRPPQIGDGGPRRAPGRAADARHSMG